MFVGFLAEPALLMVVFTVSLIVGSVITSYSIHYTKLYDLPGSIRTVKRAVRCSRAIAYTSYLN